jgi:hypothetical protein
LARASTTFFFSDEDVDGRNKSGHDDNRDPRLSSAASRCEPDSGGTSPAMTK